MLYLFLSISVIINGISIWLAYKLVRKSLSHSENITYLVDDFEDFVLHLESIYELEMFYGEETLKSLLDHSKRLRSEMNAFRENHLLDIGEEEEFYEEETENEEK
jgi:hypothetical protein